MSSFFDKSGSDLKCPNCGCGAKLIDSKKVYGNSYGLLWVCNNFPKCLCRTGCKKGTATPTGELADGELLELRKKIFERVDRVHKEKGFKTGELYDELGIKFNVIPFRIGDLNKEQCRKILKWLNETY